MTEQTTTTAIPPTNPATTILSAPPGIYRPAGTRTVGRDAVQKALLAIFGISGAGKSHLGKQLLEAPEYGPEEVLFMVRGGDAAPDYGSNVREVERFSDALDVTKDLLSAAHAGRRLPKIIFVDSISGLALGTQSYYREHPIMQWNEKAQREVHNKYAEFGEMGTGMIDLMLALGQLPCITVALCTTYENPTKPGALPELAVEGQIIPKFITQMTTAAFYLRQANGKVTRQVAEEYLAKGKLYEPHRIVLPYGPTDETVEFIDRYLYNQGGGEVITKGHRALLPREKANLPEILKKITKGGVK